MLIGLVLDIGDQSDCSVFNSTNRLTLFTHLVNDSYTYSQFVDTSVNPKIINCLWSVRTLCKLWIITLIYWDDLYNIG